MGFGWDDVAGVADSLGDSASNLVQGATDTGAAVFRDSGLDFPAELAEAYGDGFDLSQNVLNETLSFGSNSLDTLVSANFNALEDFTAQWGKMSDVVGGDLSIGDWAKGMGETYVDQWQETGGALWDNASEALGDIGDSASTLKDSLGEAWNASPFGDDESGSINLQDAIDLVTGVNSGSSGDDGGGFFGGLGGFGLGGGVGGGLGGLGGGGGGPVEQGMNRAQVQQIVEALRADREQLVELIQTAQVAVGEMATAWLGPDSKQFQADFDKQSRALEQCASMLEAMAKALAEQVGQQQDASSV